MKRRYTEASLREAVLSSSSFRQVLSRLGLVEAGGNYASIQRIIRELNLDTSHFSGRAWRRGETSPPRQPRSLEELLKKDVVFDSFKLKNKILKEGLKERKCEGCDLTQWRDVPIPLELDHINGERKDNRLENLRLLCPNCHALTETYRGRKLAKCRGETAPA